MALLGLTEYFDLAPQTAYCLRLLVALFCGILLGAERNFRAKGAGIRTHAIVASGAALFMIVSKYAFFDLGNAEWFQGFDPTLVAAFTIDGSGFLCAGIILSKKSEDDTISGMTSAANIWATAAIGMACGCGMEVLGILFTLFLLVNHLILSIRGLLDIPTRTIRITIENKPHVRALLLQLQKEFGIRLVSARYSRSDEGTVQLQLRIRSKKTIRFEDTIHFLDTHPEVKDISI